MSSSITLAAVLLIAVGVNTQEIGNCDVTINALTSFEPNDYMGRWYEQYKYPAVFESNPRCVIADYTRNADGSVKMIDYRVNRITNIRSSTEGRATFVESYSVAKLSSQYPLSLPTKYWVLATDYVNFAVVYNCNNVLFTRQINLRVLTRAAIPSASVMQEAIDAVRGFDLDTDKLVKTNQNNCNDV